MPKKFNPPPNWPSPPRGWVPPTGWQPNPDWGPAPHGWDFWVEEESKASPGSIWMVVIGSALALIGIISGFQPAGGLCGSPFSPESGAAELYDTLEGSFGGAAAGCREDIQSASVFVWALIAIGSIVLVAGIIVGSISKSRAVTEGKSAAPTVGSQIEDLHRLHQNGLLTTEEYETKKAELLRRPL